MRRLAIAALVAATALQAQLRPAEPSSVGMSAERLERAAGLVAREVEEGRVTAASLLVARRERIVLHRGFGRLHPRADSPQVQPNSVFLLASITKPVTACAVMLLAERGLVSLDDPVSHYIPEFSGEERAAVRVRELLTHTSGLPDMLPENTELRRAHAPLSDFVQRAAKTPLLYQPRKGFRYQSMGTLLAGEIAQRVSKMPLREFEKREIFEPLGMKDSSLGLGGRRIADLVWCQTSPNADPKDTARFGANSDYWRDMGHPWGGMHSSTGDLAVLLQTFLNGGAYAGKRLYSPVTVAAMTSNQNTHLDAPWGLGWAMARSQVWNYFGELVSPRTFGHVGATGTVAWADPDEQLLCVLLTNRSTSEDGGRLLRVVSNAVAAAVEE